MSSGPPLTSAGSCAPVQSAISEAAARSAADQLRVLADPTRLAMLATLHAVESPVCICEFVAAFRLSQPTISHHMAKLRHAGLVTARKQGLWTYYAAARELPSLAESVVTTLLQGSGDAGT